MSCTFFQEAVYAGGRSKRCEAIYPLPSQEANSCMIFAWQEQTDKEVKKKEAEDVVVISKETLTEATEENVKKNEEEKDDQTVSDIDKIPTDELETEIEDEIMEEHKRDEL
jgi:hypothetical protein